MVEVVVGALIVVVLGASMARALIDSNQVSADQRSHAQADQLAQQDQERLGGLSTQELTDANGQTRYVTLDGTNFKVVSTTQFLNSSGGTSCGSSGNGAAAYYKVVSSVTWPSDVRGAVVEQRIISPPQGGVLLTEVENQTGAPVSGVSVAASGPDEASAMTDSSGCAVLAGLQAGTYGLSLTLSGYVDINGNPSPLTPGATVTGTGTATPNGGNPVYMAQPGTMTATFTTDDGTQTLTGQRADAMWWDGTGATYRMPAPLSYPKPPTPPGSPASQLPTSGSIQLYPFAGSSYTNNYVVWAGDCPQMEPPTGTPTSPTLSHATIAPNTTYSASVAEPALDVVVDSGGAAVTPTHIKLSFASTSGTACSDSWYPPVATNGTGTDGALAYPGQPFASTATSGANESASNYTGSYSVCADYKSHKATVANVTNTNFSGLNPVTVTIGSTSGTC